MSQSLSPSDGGRSAALHAARWEEIEPSLLEDARGPMPAFPLDLLAPFWRDWVGGTARATGAPADYVALSVLAAVAGLAGGGAQVRIAPRWTEPLVLWQAMVGAPSSRKSTAMAPVHGLMSALEPKRPGDDADKPRRVLGDARLDEVAAALEAHPRGVILWRDEPTDLLKRLGCAQTPSQTGDETLRAWWLQAWSAGDRHAVSLLVALRPDRLDGLLHGQEELPSRFLFAWPHAPAYAPLTRREPSRDEEALAALQKLANRLANPNAVALAFDDAALAAFDAFAARLHAERGATEGLEQAWLGKGASAVARLAGALQLLAWSRDATAQYPGDIGREQLERAITLWSTYFRPHALALFHHAAPTQRERQVRQVVRWLQQSGKYYVSREEIRCKALRRAANAFEAEQILYHLQGEGVVYRDSGGNATYGRPPNRWFVNPALVKPESTGNAGKSSAA